MRGIIPVTNMLVNWYDRMARLAQLVPNARIRVFAWLFETYEMTRMTPVSIQPIARQSLAQTVMERLLDYIRDGELGPGAPLPSQQRLAEQFAVSRPVLREALQGLASTGVIDIRPGSGCYVRDADPMGSDALFDDLTHETALQVLEARMVTEVELVGMAAVRATERDFATLDRHLERLRHAVQHGRPTAQITLDLHRDLARAGHNEILFRMTELLNRQRVAQGLRVEHALPDISRHEYEHHLRLCNVVREGDPARARTAMRAHLETAHQWEQQVDQLRRIAIERTGAGD